MLFRTTDGRTIRAQYGDQTLVIGPKAKEFGQFESRFLASSYFARNFSAHVETVTVVTVAAPPADDKTEG